MAQSKPKTLHHNSYVHTHIYDKAITPTNCVVCWAMKIVFNSRAAVAGIKTTTKSDTANNYIWLLLSHQCETATLYHHHQYKHHRMIFNTIC